MPVNHNSDHRRERLWRHTKVAGGAALIYWALIPTFNDRTGATISAFIAAGIVLSAAAITTLSDRLIRLAALALAVWSHGPAAGKESDRCFPARADHFLRWVRTGANPSPTETIHSSSPRTASSPRAMRCDRSRLPFVAALTTQAVTPSDKIQQVTWATVTLFIAAGCAAVAPMTGPVVLVAFFAAPVLADFVVSTVTRFTSAHWLLATVDGHLAGFR